MSRPLHELREELHTMLHVLWTRAVGQPGYVKDDWRRLETLQHEAVTRLKDLESEFAKVEAERQRAEAAEAEVEELKREVVVLRVADAATTFALKLIAKGVIR